MPDPYWRSLCLVLGRDLAPLFAAVRKRLQQELNSWWVSAVSRSLYQFLGHSTNVLSMLIYI